MNITLVTYDQQVDFGIVGCRHSLPQIQRMIDYLEDSLVELEDAAGISSAVSARQARTTSVRPKRKARARAKTKAKAKERPKAKPKTKPKAKPKVRSKTRSR